MPKTTRMLPQTLNHLFRPRHNSSTVECGNPFIGSIVDLEKQQLRLEELIATGGFGYVFKARDVTSSNVYALKRLIASDKESREEIENEISMLQRVQTHKNIMKFYHSNQLQPNIYFLLCEYCGSGSLKNLPLPIVNRPQLHRIAYQLCLALEAIHSIGIVHRDIKIENVLFDNVGHLKVCDFGSATDRFHYPNHSWTPIQRSLLEDEMNRHTTPMYRSPEILDTYLHYPIHTAMDIWAYGCLLFSLRFGHHPFEDSSKLRIMNCNYTLPHDVDEFDAIVQMIKSCLRVNPDERASATSLIEWMDKKGFVNLNAPCVSPHNLPPLSDNFPNQANNVHEESVENANAPGISCLSGFTRIIKETSNKMAQTVHNSLVRQDGYLLLENPPTPDSVNTDPLGDLDGFLNVPTSDSTNLTFMNSRASSSHSTNSDFESKENQNISNQTPQTFASSSNQQRSHNRSNDIPTATEVKSHRKPEGNEFEDLLIDFKRTQVDNAPRCMALIRREPSIQQEMPHESPEIRIMKWTENKGRNIRALLYSLDSVIWEGCNWTAVGMHQLLSPDDVKRMYRKACLAIHPDKLAGSAHEELAKYIFMELNDAWSEFEKSQRSRLETNPFAF